MSEDLCWGVKERQNSKKQLKTKEFQQEDIMNVRAWGQ
jgi:hypothetical protein